MLSKIIKALNILIQGIFAQRRYERAADCFDAGDYGTFCARCSKTIKGHQALDAPKGFNNEKWCISCLNSFHGKTYN